MDPGRQAGGRLIEGSVSAGACASNKCLHPICSLDLLLKGITLSLQASCIAIQNVGVFWVNVSVLEEVVSHKGVVTLWVVPRKTHVLVHVEGFHVFEDRCPFLQYSISFLYSQVGYSWWGAPE